MPTTQPLFPDPAAPLPGEADLLAGAVADLGDDAPKLAYADWLEERGDRRGPFLRDFLLAAASGWDLPSATAFPRPWRDLVGVTLLERLGKHNLADRRDALLRLARPTVAITTTPAGDDALPAGATKFGGRPDLPSGVSWPTWDKGPLGFLGQFNLADLAGTAAGRDLPPAGLLSFFIANDPATGLPGAGNAYRVLFSPDVSDLGRPAPPADLPDWHRWPACRLTLAESLDLPDDESSRVAELGLTPDRLRDYAELQGGLSRSPHHLLGHVSPATLAYDPTPGPDWRHLLTVYSDDNLGWVWGGGDRLFWFLTEAGLRAGRFDGARVDHG